MSIRRKLFFAFVAAAAVPLLALGILARLYAQRERAALDQQFVEEAQAALKRLDDLACTQEAYLSQAVDSLSQELRSSMADLESLGESIDEAVKDALAKAHIASAVVHGDGFKLDEDAVARRVLMFKTRHHSIVNVAVEDLDGKVLYSDRPDPPNFRKIEASFRGDGAWPTLNKQGRRFFFRAIIDNGLQLVVEIDPHWLYSSEPFLRAGHAVYADAAGRPQVAPNEKAPDLPLVAILSGAPRQGQSGRVRADRRNWWVYSGTPGERTMYAFDGSARPFAIICEEELYAPIARFQLQVLAAMLLSLLTAVGLSYYLSGRFVQSVENLKRGVDALSRGEFSQLEKSSADELGGELVDSMNRMASALAERTRREEIESWRRLVRVLSHEINNTLGPVKSVASTVRDTLAPRLEGETGEDLKSSFKLIVDRVDSLSSFISGYAVLAKLPPPNREPAELNEVVRGAVSIFSPGKLLGTASEQQPHLAPLGSPIKNGMPIVESYDAEAGLVPIDKQQIERVVINLVKNAVEAANTRVLVRTERRGDMIQIEVEDDGPGIAAEARPHLFVPYYTTKPGGSGIGLALARQIVLGHGGTVGTHDREGGGTIVCVLLPMSLV